MTDTDSLLAAIKAAEDAGDPDALETHRAALIEIAPTSVEATEARYRLGLSKLFRHQSTDEAMALFKAAANDKRSPVAPEARVSYALILHAKQKRQQAIFELRRLLPTGVEPSVHTANALDFLALLLRESQANADELDKVEDMRRDHLEQLADAAGDPLEKAHWKLRLGAAFADSDRAGDIGRARATFSAIVKMGKKAGDSALEAAKQQLKALPR